ncbi:MAG: TatD family hydrolase [Nitrospirota bacterium]
MFIDTHTHIHGPEFDPDRDLALARARSAGVEVCVAVGTDLDDSRRAVDLAGKHPDVFAAVGVHPHEASGVTAAGLEALARLAGSERVVAWGETGLDYYYQHSPKDAQRERFADQMAVAFRLGLPLIIHTRDAWEDTFRMLDEHPHHGGVFHCFTGEREHAEAAISRGFFVSFSGIVTFAKAQALQAVASHVPLDRVLIETDCPFLAPVPNRGKRNEPALVSLVAAKLAELRGMSVEETARHSRGNARRCFPRLGAGCP